MKKDATVAQDKEKETPTDKVNVEELIEKGTLPTVQNFVSPRTGKHFDAALKLEGGRAVFDFKTRDDHRTRGGSEASVVGEEIPLPEPPPEY